MTQLFNVVLEGTDITKRVSQCNINDTINRFYNVATFRVDVEDGAVIEGSPITIKYGDHTFNGFVFAVQQTGSNTVNVEVRTNTAKLTEPFSSAENKYEDATTSHELCALYQAESGIPIINLSGNLDFEGSYERSGTMLSALQNIASVTGAEYYEQNNRVFMAPNKPVPKVGMQIPSSDIFDFVDAGRNLANDAVGTVIVQTGGSGNDLIVKK